MSDKCLYCDSSNIYEYDIKSIESKYKCHSCQRNWSEKHLIKFIIDSSRPFFSMLVMLGSFTVEFIEWVLSFRKNKNLDIDNNYQEEEKIEEEVLIIVKITKNKKLAR